MCRRGRGDPSTGVIAEIRRRLILVRRVLDNRNCCSGRSQSQRIGRNHNRRARTDDRCDCAFERLRCLIQLCPVVDFGLPNASMHKVGESAAVEDIRALSRIYERVVRKVVG